MQELRRFSLPDTNIRPIQNNKALAASSFTFNLFNYTPLVIRRTDKNKQLTHTGINRNKYTFYVLKSLEPLKNTKTSRVPWLDQVL
jgi:hypothetical protein